MSSEHAMCAHLKVEYKPVKHDNGTNSDRWVCSLCGGDFWPQHWLFPAPWQILRERLAQPSPRAGNEGLEQIIARAKSKTPCASNYECLLADLLGLAAADRRAHTQRRCGADRTQPAGLRQPCA